MSHLLHLLVLATVLAAFAPGAPARELRVALGSHGAVVLTVPDDWRDAIDRPDPATPPTVTLMPKQGKAFQILVTPLWPGIPDAPRISAGALREQVRRGADEAKPQAIEPELTVVDFSGPSGYGAYFSATDRAPEPDGYKHLTQGMLSAADLRVTFTILVNGDPTGVVQQALASLRTLRREPAK
jgi:hypothetical protein